MKQKITKQEEEYIKLLLKSKPVNKQEVNKKWLDNHVHTLLTKYKKSNKLF
jgi:hypothetical protein